MSNQNSSSPQGCECSGAPKLIFSCSGAADVGAVADRVARELTQKGIGKMFCLAGIGGRVSGILKTTEAAEAILAIDGCPLNCTKLSLEQAGFTNFEHLQLSDLGMVKGQTEITPETIAHAAEAATQKLQSAS
ncbi:MAG: putative zinc-binding protein [Planctomycetia bacterium]